MFVVVILRTCFHGMFPFHCGMFLHPSGIKDGEVTSKILAPTNPRRLHNPERTPTHLPIPSELKCLPFWLSILFSSPQRVLVCMAHLCGLNVFRWHEASPPTPHVEVNCSSDVENVKHIYPGDNWQQQLGVHFCVLFLQRPLLQSLLQRSLLRRLLLQHLSLQRSLLQRSLLFVVATFVVAAFIVAAFIVVCCCSVHCCSICCCSVCRCSVCRCSVCCCSICCCLLLQRSLLFVVAAFVVVCCCSICCCLLLQRLLLHFSVVGHLTK